MQYVFADQERKGVCGKGRGKWRFAATMQHVFVCKDYSVCMGNIDQRIVFSDSIELSRTCHIGGFHFPTMY